MNKTHAARWLKDGHIRQDATRRSTEMTEIKETESETEKKEE